MKSNPDKFEPIKQSSRYAYFLFRGTPGKAQEAMEENHKKFIDRR